MGTIYRGADEVDLPFVMVPNVVARDRRLSFRARGLLVELLSYPQGWHTSVDALAQDCAAYEACEGRKAIQGAMRELRAAGYVVQTRRQDPATGRFIWELTVRLPRDVLDEAAKHQPKRVSASAQVSPQAPNGPMAPSVPNRPMDSPAETSGPIDPKPTYGLTCGNARLPRSAHRSETDLYKKTEIRKLIPPLTPPVAHPPAVTTEDPGGGGGGHPDTDATAAQVLPQIAAAGCRLSQGEAKEIRSMISAALAAGWTPADVTARATTDLGGLRSIPHGVIARLRTLAADPPTNSSQTRALPPWCGDCDEHTRMRELADGRVARCHRCHPGAITHAAAGAVAEDAS